MGRRRALRICVGLAIATVVAVGSLAVGSGARPHTASKGKSHAPAADVRTRPNIVFILTDDLSWNLINARFAPHIVELEKRGETFTHYFVADSLCCPSRSTIFTGLFPHDTHVLTNRRDPSFDTNNTDPPAWLGRRKPLTPRQIATIDRSYRMRAESVQAVDKLLADVEATLAADHLSRNTYIVFSSDNGYHMGQHRLLRGKQTAFDTDIRVPLIVSGPSVPRAKVVPQVAQNVDLYPTFAQLGGATPSAPIDGHSLVPLLHPKAATTIPWRTIALVEHRCKATNPGDPDFDDGKAAGDPTTYDAIRISGAHLPGFSGPVEAVYVEYQDPAHELEYYDIRKDPFEIDNVASSLTGARKAELHKILVGLENCHNGRSCWTAALPS